MKKRIAHGVVSEQDREQYVKELEDSKKAMLNVLEDLGREKKNLQIDKIKDDAILNQIADGVIVVDERGSFVVFNKAAVSIIGMGPTTLSAREQSKHYGFYHADGATLLAAVDTPILRAMRGEDVRDAEYFVRNEAKPKGVYIRMSALPLRIDGAVRGAVAIFHDISRDKEIDRARSEFISFASHQLRTPITSIRWAIDQLRKHVSLDGMLREYIDDIDRVSLNVEELAEQLLSKTRLELGSTQLQCTSFDAAKEVQEIVGRYQSVADRRGIHLSFARGREISVYTDRFSLRTIAGSLILNAIDYTHARGSVEVALEEDRDTMRLSIRDTGIGIPKEDQSKIFGRFFRASNASLTKANGTGLGLYIAHETAQLLGGRISFDSVVNKGSLFTAEIPRTIGPYVPQRPKKG